MPRVPRARGLECLGMAAKASFQSSSPASLQLWGIVATRSFSNSRPALRILGTGWLKSKLSKKDSTTSGEKSAAQDNHVIDVNANIVSTRQLSGPVQKRPRLRPQSKLPPRRTEAESEAKVGTSKAGQYLPATTLSELEPVVPLHMWWKQKEHWGPESQFTGFAHATKVEDRAQLEVYLRRAVVEIVALEQSGEYAKMASMTWRTGSERHRDLALSMDLQVVDGRARLKGDVLAIIRSLKPAAREKEAPKMMPVNEARQVLKAWDASWKSLVMDDSTRFLLRKRLYQLTGNLIPDYKISAARTVQHLITLAAKKDEPEKLAVCLQRIGLKKLPNVKVHKTKIRMIEKEVAVGRWKIIREELRKRGLPVLGVKGVPSHKERAWLMGAE